MLFYTTHEKLKQHARRHFPEAFSRLPSIQFEYVDRNSGGYLVRLENQVDITYTIMGKTKYKDSQLTHLKPFCWLTSGTDYERRCKKDILLSYYISSEDARVSLSGHEITGTFRSACEEIADALQATKAAVDDPTKWSITVAAQPQIQIVGVEHYLHAFL